MVQAVRHNHQNDSVKIENSQTSIWTTALLVALGWVISNIVVYLVTDWFLSGAAGIEFEPRFGAALLLGILGLLAGFTLSLAFWYTQENFIGIHALAYTVMLTLLTAIIAYVPDGTFILPILFVGLYVGLKWANPEIGFAHILASFLVWMTVASLMFLVILMLPYSTANPLMQVIWQCVWSGSVGFFGSAFMFWQLNKPQTEVVPSAPEVKNDVGTWENVYHTL